MHFAQKVIAIADTFFFYSKRIASISIFTDIFICMTILCHYKTNRLTAKLNFAVRRVFDIYLFTC